MSDNQKIHTHKYNVTADECDAQGMQSATEIVRRLIECATEHANILGIGYDALIRSNLGWVLSRLSVDMTCYPAINDAFVVETWIEGYNRRYSDRCFRIIDAAGDIIGEARSVWVAIDITHRTLADLSEFQRDAFPVVASRVCAVDRAPRIAIAADAADVSARNYSFTYCDLDFNRHVNTVMYLRTILNGYTLEWHDTNVLRRLDLQFNHECYYGQTVTINMCPVEPDTDFCEIIRPDGQRAVAARLIWHKR